MTVTASPQSGQQGTIGDATRLKAAGGISPWWYNWVDRHRVAGIALVGVIATQLGTYFGYVFPAIGLDRRMSVILVGLGGALGINTWLMKGFLDSIPDSLDESARVDGATPGQVFWGIILPLATPVLAVVGLLSYIFSINEFIIASRLLQTTDKWTLPVGLYGFISDKYASQWGPFCAGVVLAAIPVVILFFFLQRYITEGLTRGAVKG